MKGLSVEKDKVRSRRSGLLKTFVKTLAEDKKGWRITSTLEETAGEIRNVSLSHNKGTDFL